MSGPIIDEPAFAYPGYGGTESRRRLRVWRVQPGEVVAVLTENDADRGTSITNAAGDIFRLLRARFPDDTVQVVEHYPDCPAGSRYSSVALHEEGPRWRHLPDADARALLPGLDDGGEDESAVPGWRMPPELEPFRALVSDTGGNSVERLMTLWNTPRSRLISRNLPLYLCAVSTAAQVRLLLRLHRRGMLR